MRQCWAECRLKYLKWPIWGLMKTVQGSNPINLLNEAADSNSNRMFHEHFYC